MSDLWLPYRGLTLPPAFGTTTGVSISGSSEEIEIPLVRRATGGTDTDDGTIVTHEFTADGTFSLTGVGTLSVDFSFTGTGTFGGASTDGTAEVTEDVAITVTSGSVLVTYNPISDWVPDPMIEDWMEANAMLFMDAEVGVADTGGTVDTWTDRSSNGWVATAFGGVTTESVTINGMNAIRFPGASGMNLPEGFRSAMAALSSAELFMVIECDADVGATGKQGHPFRMTGVASSPEHSHMPWGDGQVYEGWCNTTRHIVGNPAQTLVDPFLYRIRSYPSDYEVFMDEVSIFSTSSSSYGVSSRPASFGWSDDGASGSDHYWAGNMAMAIVVDGADMTSGIRDDIVAFLSSRFGVGA